jgi:PAS domain S-box-containing protein
MTQKRSAQTNGSRPARSRNNAARKRAEEALGDSEATYREIFNAVNEGILVLDMETGEIVDANATFCNVFGYTPEEVRQLRVGDFSSGRFAYTQEDALRLIYEAARGQPQRFDWLAKSRDGRLLWIDVNLKPATIAGRDRMLAIGRDITERKLVEQEVRKFKTISDRAGYGSAISDLEGNLLYVNESFADMHGYTARELVGKNLAVFHNEAQTENVERLKHQLVRSGNYVDEEVWHKRRDNTTFPTLMTGTLIRDEAGKPLYMAATAIDITERKRAEEALRESEERFRKLSDATFEGIAIHRKGTILDANQALATMFGYEPSDVIGMHALNLTAPGFRDSFSERMASGYQKPFETVGLKKDGSTFPCEIWCKPMPWRGQTATVAALRDLTERKQMEEALQKAREELEARVESQMERGNPYGLTFRELTVLHLVAAGKADKEIGSELGISPLTASKHVANILAKMGAACRTEACVRAFREALLD